MTTPTKPTLTNAMIEQKRYGYNLILFISIPRHNYTENASLTFSEVSGEWQVYTSGMSTKSFAKLARIVPKLPTHIQILAHKLPEFCEQYHLPTEAVPAILKYAELVDYREHDTHDCLNMFEAFRQSFYHLTARSVPTE